MLSKDVRRGERRWKSHCKFLRRVKMDWNDHGWNWNWLWTRPYSMYKPDPKACSIWEATDLCQCFYDPNFGGMARFKDTPHFKCSPYECNPRQYTHGLESRPIQEWRAEEVVRENHHSRVRRLNAVIRLRKTCFCGFVFGTTSVEVRDYRRSFFGMKWCDSCKKKLGNKEPA